MKIHIVNYELGFNDGILSKFANKLYEELKKIDGLEVTISKTPNLEADINHHVNYLPYKHNPEYKGIDTLMVTHIFEGYKKDALTEQMKTAFGICMSNDTKKQLVKWGFDKKKLTTVLPAHDLTKYNGHIHRRGDSELEDNGLYIELYKVGWKRDRFSVLVKSCVIIDDENVRLVHGLSWRHHRSRGRDQRASIVRGK